MIAELGIFALIIALFFALFLSIFPGLGVLKDNKSYLNVGSIYASGLLLFLLIAYLCLSFAFLTDDFTLLYVYSHSSRNLPWFYKFCAVWGGHEGSMLLWVLILSAWSLLFGLSNASLEPKFRALVFVILGLLSAAFILFLLTTSNPFIRLFQPGLTEGRDLNPLLQDLGFLLHPPVLYLGYVGFALGFAFAISCLILGRFEARWANWVKPWILSAWCFLTLGITLGSWWAYRELGWGGWWFWDPVENASLMPWLAATALLHGLTVAEKRQQFLSWTLFLAILTFSLSLMGTFLVRSGVLTSVHAFAVDPARGLYILVFLSVVIGGSLLLFAWRANTVTKVQSMSLLSRESALLLATVFLMVMMLSILMGTLYPLIIDALGLGKLSVGAPYFNTVILPLGLALLALMGLGLHLKWQVNSGKGLTLKLLPIFFLSGLVSAFCLWFWAGFIQIYSFLGLTLALWVIFATLSSFIEKLRAGIRLNQSFFAMVLAHLGLAVMVIGISLSSGYGIEADVRVKPQEDFSFAGYRLRLLEERALEGPNYRGTQAVFSLNSGSYQSLIYPERRFYSVAKTMMTDAAIDVTLFRDLYLALGDHLEDGSWVLRLYFKPMVRWIWGGGFMVLLGGLLALSDKRYLFLRKRSKRDIFA